MTADDYAALGTASSTAGLVILALLIVLLAIGGWRR